MLTVSGRSASNLEINRHHSGCQQTTHMTPINLQIEVNPPEAHTAYRNLIEASPAQGYAIRIIILIHQH
jgi:hypothetical protein